MLFFSLSASIDKFAPDCMSPRVRNLRFRHAIGMENHSLTKARVRDFRFHFCRYVQPVCFFSLSLSL